MSLKPLFTFDILSIVWDFFFFLRRVTWCNILKYNEKRPNFDLEFSFSRKIELHIISDWSLILNTFYKLGHYICVIRFIIRSFTAMMCSLTVRSYVVYRIFWLCLLGLKPYISYNIFMAECINNDRTWRTEGHKVLGAAWPNTKSCCFASPVLSFTTWGINCNVC